MKHKIKKKIKKSNKIIKLSKHQRSIDEVITDISWAVSRRLLIQELLYDLHCFDVKNKDFHLTTDHQSWHQFNRMVAVAFSLWRSCFLAEELAGTRAKKSEHRVAFTGKLVKINAINFPWVGDKPSPLGGISL